MSSCPISGESVDENVSRIVGSIVGLLALIYLLSTWWVWLFLLLFDFFARVYWCNMSPLARIAKVIRRRYMPPKLIDAAPKLFAARVGLFMVVVSTFSHVVGWTGLAQVVMVLLFVAAGLEAIWGVCVGCLMYGWSRALRSS